MDEELKTLAKQHPKLIETLLQAGYKARKCKEPQVYCRYAAALHEDSKLVKQVVSHKDGVAQKYEIVAILVDLAKVTTPGDVGVSFTVEYAYGQDGHFMLEKMAIGSKIDLVPIEQLFHKVFQAV